MRNAVCTSSSTAPCAGLDVRALRACILAVIGCSVAAGQATGGDAHLVQQAPANIREEHALFQGLDHLPGGQDISYAYGMSDDGDEIVGESFSPISQVHGEGTVWRRIAPLTWQATGIGLPTGDSLNSPAAGASGNGRWIVGRVSFAPPTAPTLDTDAYRWSTASGFERLGVPQGDVLAAATDASASGDVVIGYGGPQVGYADLRALVWTRAERGWVPAHLESDYHSEALRVDGTGTYVVGWARSEAAEAAAGPGGREAVLWVRDDGGTQRRVWLGALPDADFYSMPFAVQRLKAKVVITGFSGSGNPMLPIAWTIDEKGATEMRELPLPPRFTSGVAVGMSKDGTRIVGNCWGDGSGTFELAVCIWEAGTVTTLEERLAAAGVEAFRGWTLWSVVGISADGAVICGSGTDPDGYDRPWVARLD